MSKAIEIKQVVVDEIGADDAEEIDDRHQYLFVDGQDADSQLGHAERAFGVEDE